MPGTCLLNCVRRHQRLGLLGSRPRHDTTCCGVPRTSVNIYDPTAHGLYRIALSQPLEDDLLGCHVRTVDPAPLLVNPLFVGKGQT